MSYKWLCAEEVSGKLLAHQWRGVSIHTRKPFLNRMIRLKEARTLAFLEANLQHSNKQWECRINTSTTPTDTSHEFKPDPKVMVKA